MNEKLVYIKTKNGNILKCYVSEQMHKPIYHPVNNKTNGYVDYNDVERKLNIEDMYLTVKELQQENESLNVKLYKFEYYEEANDVLLKENKKLQQRNHDLLIAKTEKMDIIMNQSSAIEKLKQHEQNKKLEKIKSYLETTYTEWFNWKNDILEILESNKED